MRQSSQAPEAHTQGHNQTTYLDGLNFRIEHACLGGGAPRVLGTESVLIHLLPADVVLGRQVLGGDRHRQLDVRVRQCRPQDVLQVKVRAQQLGLEAHVLAVHCQRRLRHAFRTANQRNAALTQQDVLNRQGGGSVMRRKQRKRREMALPTHKHPHGMARGRRDGSIADARLSWHSESVTHLSTRDDSLEARAAQAVDTQSRGGQRHAGLKSSVAGQIRSVRGRLRNLAKDNIVNHRWVHLQQRWCTTRA